jgi:hypothetical protein
MLGFIVDECHEFDDVMSNFISIKITEGVIKFKFSNEKDMISRLKAVSGIIDYVEFLRYMSTKLLLRWSKWKRVCILNQEPQK